MYEMRVRNELTFLGFFPRLHFIHNSLNSSASSNSPLLYYNAENDFHYCERQLCSRQAAAVRPSAEPPTESKMRSSYVMSDDMSALARGVERHEFSEA